MTTVELKRWARLLSLEDRIALQRFTIRLYLIQENERDE